MSTPKRCRTSSRAACIEISRDISLALSTDGFAPFKGRRSTAWPGQRHLSGLHPRPQTNERYGFDASKKEVVTLRAHLCLLFGDMPAVAKLMNMKGHNGAKPFGSSQFPSAKRPPQPPRSPQPPQTLPRRLSRRCRSSSQRCNQRRGREDRKGLSFPLDFMHLIFENVTPHLLDLWTGENRHCDPEQDDFVLASLDAESQIPSSSDLSIPQRLTCSEYLKLHLAVLAASVNTCLSFSYPPGFSQDLRTHLAAWVVEFERLYYRGRPERVGLCFAPLCFAP
ncbi:hypothetical protein CALCODRAFT_505077 [Calocera cornea HHB12733]|uniref:Uncharacterized protein n=1 Tax=Calocera cornea HHB12733 TaxID=1353952 RepID=A0A165C138_9BASI|nr:hypothetical protein CALCODRAFT_505077 [Calocera cornea HHB12733]